MVLRSLRPPLPLAPAAPPSAPRLPHWRAHKNKLRVRPTRCDQSWSGAPALKTSTPSSDTRTYVDTFLFLRIVGTWRTAYPVPVPRGLDLDQSREKGVGGCKQDDVCVTCVHSPLFDYRVWQFSLPAFETQKLNCLGASDWSALPSCSHYIFM